MGANVKMDAPSVGHNPAANGKGDNLLDIQGLKTYFYTEDGVVKAVDGVDIKVKTRTDAGHRRRIGLRQECHIPFHHAAHRCTRQDS